MARREPTTAAEISFWRRDSARRIAAGLASVFFVIAMGVMGYVLLGWSLSDALFQVVITISGVGFGEVRPLTGLPTRVHTMLVIVFGVIAVAYTVSGLLQLVTEGELQKVMGHERLRKRIETLCDHVVIVGFGRMGALIAEELSRAGVPFVVVEVSVDRAPEIDKMGYLHVLGDATEESVLAEAGLDRAKQLVTVVPSDADNVFITLTARQMAPTVQIIARAELPSTQRKLEQAGANHVVSPAVIGARRMTGIITNPFTVQFIDLMTAKTKLAIEMDEIAIPEGSSLANRSLREADIARRTGVVVVALKRADGEVVFPPVVDQPLNPGDTLVLMGGRSNLDQFRMQFCTGEHKRPPQPPAV